MEPWRIPIFGVRHLSPTGAWHLRRYLDRIQPEVVLIEGLADANGLIEPLTRAETRPPVAILAYTDAPPVRTLIYPMARYCPEYQAMLWAGENEARCEFIDLPSDIFLALQDIEAERIVKARDAAGEGEPTTPEAESWKPEREVSIYERIAERCGEGDYDTYWERRFEHCLADDGYRLAAFELGKALREEPDPPRWRAENLVREAYMRRRIAEVIAAGTDPSRIVAVVGAFHAPVLSGDFPAMTDEELASLRRRPSKLTLMPYSYFKLSSQSGYGAGNKAPAYFEMLWEMLQAGDLPGLPGRYLSCVARHMRSKGTHRSTAEVIEGVRLSRTLSALHDGHAPTLRDLHDSAVAIIGQGEPVAVAEALREIDVGTAIGELPAGVSQTSIQADFERQMARLKLEKFQTTAERELALDLRENRRVQSEEAAFLDLHRSSFFHHLRMLKIGFAIPMPAAQQSATWAEKWKLRWSAENEIALVEAVLLGETVELATAFQFKTSLEAATTIAEAADLVDDACRCGLMTSMELARRRLQELAAASSEFPALAHAAFRLGQVTRYGDVRRFDPSGLLPLMEELFVQGSLALHDAANCDGDAARKVLVGIEEMNRVCLDRAPSAGDDGERGVDEPLWIERLKRLADADDRNPMLSGFACAILLERGLVANADLAREVSRRLSPGIPADLGAGWFEGLAKRNRYSLLARQPLWVELATYIESLDDEQFKRAVVFLRRAFGSFSPQEKRQITENLGEYWGLGADAASELIEAPMTEKEAETLGNLNDFDFDDI